MPSSSSTSRDVPKIVKCELCRHRVEPGTQLANQGGFSRYPAGMGPACCEVCPREAVIYGKREELLAEANRRIAANPGMYFKDRVYGETEGGGTQVLYLSLGERHVKSSNGLVSRRPVIRTAIEILGQRREVELTLVPRDEMGFRILLGREAIKNGFLVDPGRSYLGGRPKKRKGKG